MGVELEVGRACGVGADGLKGRLNEWRWRALIFADVDLPVDTGLYPCWSHTHYYYFVILYYIIFFLLFLYVFLYVYVYV